MAENESGHIGEFLAFSREYAEALEALEAIEKKGETIAGLGGGEDLRAFVEQFVAMAQAAEERASAAGLTEIASWFRELIGRAEGVNHRLGV
jgi:hypothetical protein